MSSQLKTSIIIILTVILLISLIKNVVDYQQKLSLFSQSDREYQKLANESKSLKSELKKNSDPSYTEEKIRNQLNLLKRNEVAVIVPTIKLTPTPTPTPIKSPSQQWIELFLR